RGRQGQAARLGRAVGVAAGGSVLAETSAPAHKRWRVGTEDASSGLLDTGRRGRQTSARAVPEGRSAQLAGTMNEHGFAARAPTEVGMSTSERASRRYLEQTFEPIAGNGLLDRRAL